MSKIASPTFFVLFCALEGLWELRTTGQNFISRRGQGSLSFARNLYKTYQKRLSYPLVEHSQWYNNIPCMDGGQGAVFRLTDPMRVLTGVE